MQGLGFAAAQPCDTFEPRVLASLIRKLEMRAQRGLQCIFRIAVACSQFRAFQVPMPVRASVLTRTILRNNRYQFPARADLLYLGHYTARVPRLDQSSRDLTRQSCAESRALELLSHMEWADHPFG